MVEAELRQRGVPRHLLEELRGTELAEPSLDVEGLPETEEERARAALLTHLRGRPMPAEPKAIQRLGAFLMRRGFDPDTVRAAIRAGAAESTPGGSTADPGGMDAEDG